jgi:class 3 adenylate cyclase
VNENLKRAVSYSRYANKGVSVNESNKSKESERRIATVMFADISGFTAMSEMMDPEQVTSASKSSLSCTFEWRQNYLVAQVF